MERKEKKWKITDVKVAADDNKDDDDENDDDATSLKPPSHETNFAASIHPDINLPKLL